MSIRTPRVKIPFLTLWMEFRAWPSLSTACASVVRGHSRPQTLYYGQDTTCTYANGLTNDMTIIDVATLKAEKSVPVGRLPWGVAIMP